MGHKLMLMKQLIQTILKCLDKVYGDIEAISKAMFKDPIVISRFENTGYVSKDFADAIGMVGLHARSSGRDVDIRRDLPFGYYKKCCPKINVLTTGDVFSRSYIRYLDAIESVKFIKQTLQHLPKEVENVVCEKIASNSLVFSFTESWRGEVIHFLQSDSNGKIEQYKIKDPSFNNWAALELAVRGNGVSDFPICNKSFDLSYCAYDL